MSSELTALCTVDLIVNVVLTLSFILPIARSRFPQARRLAQRYLSIRLGRTTLT